MTTIDGKCHRYSSVCFNANISAAKLHIWLIGVLAHNISDQRWQDSVNAANANNYCGFRGWAKVSTVY